MIDPLLISTKLKKTRVSDQEYRGLTLAEFYLTGKTLFVDRVDRHEGVVLDYDKVWVEEHDFVSL